MKKLFLLVFICFSFSLSQNPDNKWIRYKSAEEAGWSSEKLYKTCINSGAASIILVYKGKVVYAYGEYCRQFKMHSARKSILSALYGIYKDKGFIDLNKTIRELNISDKTPLTNQEKDAKIVDLLKSRSGIYHSAGQETEYMKKSKPQRGSHYPGTFWYYNNWDFNVLGTIFNQETKKDIFESFYNEIAVPLQMQDFILTDGCYDYELESSIHPAYIFKLSARDMARFGQLYLQNGNWNGKQIIPVKWIEESTTSYSKTENDKTTYGYLWWIMENFQNMKVYYASGVGGQRIYVFPSLEIVLAMNADTYSGNSILDADYVMEDIVLNARTSIQNPHPEFTVLNENDTNSDIKEDKIDLSKYIGKYKINNDICTINLINGELFINGVHYCLNFKLIPIKNDILHIKDIDLYLFCELDKEGKPINIQVHKSEIEKKLYELILNEGMEKTVLQISNFRDKIINMEELKFLINELTPKNIETLELRKLNALCFPNSYQVQLDLKNYLLKNKDINFAEKTFRDILEYLKSKGIKNTKTEWFYNIIKANTFKKTISEQEGAKYTGNYGSEHIIIGNGNLYYYSDKAEKKYNLYKMDNNSFALDNVYNMYLVFSENEKGVVSKISSNYYRETVKESIKDK